jgi:copper chaperone CopZ
MLRLAVGAVLSCQFGCLSDPRGNAERIVPPPQMQANIATHSYALHVKGMGCPLCATNVRKAIERQPGVGAVNIDLGKGIVTVASRPNLEPTESDLRQAVANAGFELAKIERAQ